MAYYLFKLIPPRPTFNVDMTEEERSVMKEHGAWWRERAESGTAIAVGPVLDPAGVWGVAICELKDDEDPEAFTAGDPVKAKGLGFRYEAHRMPAIILRGGNGKG